MLEGGVYDFTRTLRGDDTAGGAEGFFNSRASLKMSHITEKALKANSTLVLK